MLEALTDIPATLFDELFQLAASEAVGWLDVSDNGIPQGYRKDTNRILQSRYPLPSPLPLPSSESTSVDSSSELSGPATEPPPVLVFSCLKGEIYGVTQEQIDEWSDAYPAVDVTQQLKAMKAWLNAHPAKRKTKNGIPRFVVNWLSKEQNRGGSRTAGEAPRERDQLARAKLLAKKALAMVEDGEVKEAWPEYASLCAQENITGTVIDQAWEEVKR
jgi:hypothetical protein